MEGMEATANTTVDTAAAETVELTVLDTPMSIPAALTAVDADGWLTAVVPVSPYSLLEGRAEQEAGDDYPIVGAMVSGSLEPMEMSYEVVGHREGGVLLLQASFTLHEAVTVYYDEDEIAEMEAQAA